MFLKLKPDGKKMPEVTLESDEKPVAWVPRPEADHGWPSHGNQLHDLKYIACSIIKVLWKIHAEGTLIMIASSQGTVYQRYNIGLIFGKECRILGGGK